MPDLPASTVSKSTGYSFCYSKSTAYWHPLDFEFALRCSHQIPNLSGGTDFAPDTLTDYWHPLDFKFAFRHSHQIPNLAGGAVFATINQQQKLADASATNSNRIRAYSSYQDITLPAGSIISKISPKSGRIACLGHVSQIYCQ